MYVARLTIKREFGQITVNRPVKSTYGSGDNYEIMVSSSSGNVH